MPERLARAPQPEGQQVTTDKFFDETTDQSQVKAEIVEKYFFTWAGIITATQSRYRPGAENRIGYVDLFAGPGRYKDGAASTPLRVLQQAIEKPVYAERLMTIFNDKDEAQARSLEQSIQALPGIERLKHKPQIWNEEVGDSIAHQFEDMRTIPLLAFIDPWGYKGLTLRLVNAFLKDWGCDCLFFFNYNRINMGLNNPSVHEHICAPCSARTVLQLCAISSSRCLLLTGKRRSSTSSAWR